MQKSSHAPIMSVSTIETVATKSRHQGGPLPVGGFAYSDSSDFYRFDV